MKNYLLKRALRFRMAFLFFMLALFSLQRLSAGEFTVEASGLTPEIIKKHSDLKITGVLTAEVVEAFKHSGTGSYTASPNFNVKSVDFSDAELTDSLAMDSIFMNYLSLKKVVMPVRGVEYIRSLEFAFFTTVLAEVDLRACRGVVSLRQAFDGCKQLTRVNISGCEKIENLFLAFSNAPNLAQIEMPENAPGLRFMFHMLISNKSLTEIRLPAVIHPACESGYSFVDCSALEKVTLPSNLPVMKEAAFFSCPNLRTLWYEGEQMLEWNEKAFTSSRAESTTQPGEITLFVKQAWLDDYRADAGWQIIKAVEPIPEPVPDGISDERVVESFLNVFSGYGLVCVESMVERDISIYNAFGCLADEVHLDKGITCLRSLPEGCYLLIDKGNPRNGRMKFMVR